MAGGRFRVAAASCQGPNDPAFRVRLEIPGRALAAHGIALELMPLFSEAEAGRFRSEGPVAKAAVLMRARRRLLRELRELDEELETMVVQRHVDLSPLPTLERAAADRRLVYDVDDAIWLSGRVTGGSRLSFAKGAERKVRWLAERAEHVIAGNDYLAEYLDTYSHAVTVVPSLIDTDGYTVRRHEQSETVTLGWIGSETTAPYLRRLTPVLERVATNSMRPVRLLVVGGAAPRPEGVLVEERIWSPDSERGALAEMDIGLMPLDDTLWSRGKCAYKALQYMAAGIPSVVDDVGISAATVDGAGHVARDENQWLEGLVALADDAGFRARLGEIGRQRIEDDFSVRRWLPTIEAILVGN